MTKPEIPLKNEKSRTLNGVVIYPSVSTLRYYPFISLKLSQLEFKKSMIIGNNKSQSTLRFWKCQVKVPKGYRGSKYLIGKKQVGQK